jgi:hypothetical protein
VEDKMTDILAQPSRRRVAPELQPALESIRLKAALLVDGVNFTPGVFTEVGTRFKEQNHGLFGWDFADHKGLDLPDDFILSDGTVVQLRYNPCSAYVMQLRGEQRVIAKDGQALDEVRLIPRPRYYDVRTPGGAEMRRIAQIGGEDCFFVCYQNYCSHFAGGEQCLFCNLVSTKKTYDSVLTRKDVHDIGRAAQAAFSEGAVRHILLTGGCFSHEQEVTLVASIVESIRSALGVSRVPGTILPSATLGEDDIRRYRDTGIGAIGYSMEIWDEALYRGICPGKAKTVPHDEFLDGIRKAVRIFGPGNVYGVFVMGLEPRKSLLEGVRVLSEIGANVVPFVWSPNPGSKFEGHRAPTAEWYFDTIFAAADIVESAGVPSGTANHCYRCDGNSLLHDALSTKGVE